MASLRRRLGVGGLSALLLVAAAAAQKPIPPAPQAFVWDEADWLSASEEQRLAAQLAQYERESSNQIVVAIFRSLDGEDLATYSQQVAESWAIGQGARDNGILLAVYAEDRLIDIEVGYGLEGAVTDLIAAQIRDQRLRPAFRAGRYAEGLSLAVADLIAASRGEYEGSGRTNADAPRSRGIGIPFFFIILLFMLLAGRRARRNYLGAYLLGSALGQIGGSHRRGGGGFGGGGGGFRGGGGSFGGGGARGGW